jgi:hypothetical protein
VDVHILAAERQRIAERLNSTRTCLGILRAQIIGCLTDEARQHLLCALEEEAEMCRELAGALLQVEGTILALEIKRPDDADEESTIRLDRPRVEGHLTVQQRSD